MQTEFAMPDGSYNKDLAISRYNDYLFMYQGRYTLNFEFVVTWATISFWRNSVIMWGDFLVANGWLHKEQYLADKAFRYGEPLIIEQMQAATALTVEDIC